MAPGLSVDVQNTPAASPPPGILSNLKHPQTPHTVFLAMGIFWLSMTSIAVALRVFTKVHVMRPMHTEDYALIVAQLGFVAWITLNFAVPGQGRHLWDISIYDAMRFAKYQNCIIILYGPLIFLAKFSILLQIRRLLVFKPSRPTAYFIIQGLIVANLAFYVAYLFVDIFQCTPREKIWNSSLPGKCVSLNVLLLAPAGMNIISDVTVLVLPIALVWNLQMTLRNKLGVAAILSSGSFALVSGIMRLVFSYRVTQTADKIRAVYPVAIWSAAELGTVILAATLPAAPCLWRYLKEGDRSAHRRLSKDAQSAPPFYKPQYASHYRESTASGPEEYASSGRRDGLQWPLKDAQDGGGQNQIMETHVIDISVGPRNCI